MADSIVNYKSLGIRIQQRRQLLGLTQSEAAEKLNLSTSFFSRVERGEKVASLETIIKIANVFELSLDYLFQDSMRKSIPDDLQIELSQIFIDKSLKQTERLIAWLKMLSENIGRIS